MSTAAKPKTVWSGDDALKRLLVPITDLRTSTANPRVGDLNAISASLERFGQYRPIVADSDGAIIAGNHTFIAARDRLGWTHIAAVRTALNGDEARAALLADNRTADLGSYDTGLLAEHLSYLAELDLLAGTGYTTDDLDGYLAELAKMAVDDEMVQVSFAARRPGDVRELVLMYSPAQFEQVETWLAIVRKETGVDGASEAVFEALRLAAAQLNG